MITTRYRTRFHGLCTVSAEPDCSRSNTAPAWKNARAFDTNGHAVAVDDAAIDALNIAWADELRFDADDSGCEGAIEGCEVFS